MPKAYWIVHVSVADPEAYSLYRAAVGTPVARHDGRFLVRAGAQTVVEGSIRARTVVVEFPSLQAATECYYSPEYQAAIPLRHAASEADFSIVEGWEG